MVHLPKSILPALALFTAVRSYTPPDTIAATVQDPADRAEALQVLQGATQDAFIAEEDIATVVHALAVIRSGFPDVREIHAGSDDTELFLALSEEAWAELLRRVPGAQPGDELPGVYDAVVDSVAAALGMTSVILDDFLSGRVKVQVSRPLNVWVAAERFQNLPAVEYAGPEIYVGDGDYIYARFAGDSLHLTFRRGWGDCLSGCIHERRYLFIYDRRTREVAKVGETAR